MNSKKLKTEVLKYWRFTRHYNLCATEVNTGTGIADILVSNDKEIVEIEIKISYSDFLKDFEKRKYIGIKDNPFYFLDANRFFFCVPIELEIYCISYLKEKNYPFGLFSYNGRITMVKSCRTLKKINVNRTKTIKRWILQRATSELVQLRGEVHVS